jgi:hypothetical protein
VEKETVKAVIRSFLKTNIEELSTIERSEMAAFLKLTKLFLMRFAKLRILSPSLIDNVKSKMNILPNQRWNHIKQQPFQMSCPILVTRRISERDYDCHVLILRNQTLLFRKIRSTDEF